MSRRKSTAIRTVYQIDRTEDTPIQISSDPTSGMIKLQFEIDEVDTAIVLTPEVFGSICDLRSLLIPRRRKTKAKEEAA